MQKKKASRVTSKLEDDEYGFVGYFGSEAKYVKISFGVCAKG